MTLIKQNAVVVVQLFYQIGQDRIKRARAER
jgi:hypothetical protein